MTADRWQDARHLFSGQMAIRIELHHLFPLTGPVELNGWAALVLVGDLKAAQLLATQAACPDCGRPCGCGGAARPGAAG